MTITPEQFDLFEQQYMLDRLKDPTYRYGQAFLNHFETFGQSLDPNEFRRLFLDHDQAVCRGHVLRYIQKE